MPNFLLNSDEPLRLCRVPYRAPSNFLADAHQGDARSHGLTDYCRRMRGPVVLLAVVLLLGGCTERAPPARAPAAVTGVPTATGTSAAATATPAPGLRRQRVLDAGISG